MKIVIVEDEMRIKEGLSNGGQWEGRIGMHPQD